MPLHVDLTLQLLLILSHLERDTFTLTHWTGKTSMIIGMVKVNMRTGTCTVKVALGKLKVSTGKLKVSTGKLKVSTGKLKVRTGIL